jgi:hypothetical protein
MDPEDERIAAMVAQHGWHCTMVGAGPRLPAFAYTTGLVATFEHPELVIFGLRERLMYDVFHGIVGDLRGGKSYAEPQTYGGVLENVEIAVRPVHETRIRVLLGYAMAFYRLRGESSRLRAVQVLWPDKAGSFPFDAGCDPVTRASQPLLDVPVPPAELAAFFERRNQPLH